MALDDLCTMLSSFVLGPRPEVFLFVVPLQARLPLECLAGINKLHRLPLAATCHCAVKQYMPSKSYQQYQQQQEQVQHDFATHVFRQNLLEHQQQLLWQAIATTVLHQQSWA